MGLNIDKFKKYLVSAESDRVHWNKGEDGFTTPCGVYSVANKNAEVVDKIKREMVKYGLNYNNRSDVLYFDKTLSKSFREELCDMATRYELQKYIKLPEELIDIFDENTLLVYFSISVNAGNKRANKLLQEHFGAYPDGIIGKRTIEAIVLDYMELVQKFGEGSGRESFNRALQYAMISEMIDFYHKLATQDRYKRYLRGWLNRMRNLARVVGVEYAWIK